MGLQRVVAGCTVAGSHQDSYSFESPTSRPENRREKKKKKKRRHSERCGMERESYRGGRLLASLNPKPWEGLPKSEGQFVVQRRNLSVQGLEIMVWGLGFMVSGLGFKV